VLAWNCWLVPGWEDMQILEAAARLPVPEQEEAVELLSRYSPAGTRTSGKHRQHRPRSAARASLHL